MASSLGSTLAGASDVFCGCDYCGDDREAAGFCTNCQDFLCVECFRAHLKPRRLRHHVLLNRDQMPCPEDRNRRGADSDTGSQDDQSSDSSSLGASDISTRPELVRLPETAEQGARYRPTRVSYRACIKTTVILVSAVLTLLLAVWLSHPHSPNSNSTNPNSPKPNSSNPNSPKPNSSKPNSPKPNSSKPNSPKPNSPKPNSPKPNSSKPNSRPVTRNTRAEHVYDMGVIDDKEMNMSQYSITGIVVMPGEKLVTVNPRSGNVKLIDLKINTVIAQLNLPRSLWGITQISNTQVAVTSDNKQKIHFVNVNDKLKLGHSIIQVEGKCTGITRLHDNLLVTYYKPAKVELLNMKGKLVKTIVTETKAKRLFVHPRYIAVSPDQSTIYISDWYKDTVTRLTLAGKVLAKYQDKASLVGPRGLVVDNSGSVYVCGEDSQNVVQLTADLTQPRLLIQKPNDMKYMYPKSASYCQATGRLYIGMSNSRVVKVYQLNKTT